MQDIGVEESSGLSAPWHTVGDAPTWRSVESNGDEGTPEEVSETAQPEVEAKRSTIGPGSARRVLVTIPVHNEVELLLDSIRRLDAAFRSTDLDYHLSIAEDGSTDGTKDLLRQLPLRWPGILLQEDPDPLGRGRALRQLWSKTDADVYCFTDADLAAGPEAVVVAAQRVVDGAPIVIGSRYVPGACTNRPPLRSFVSRGYNRLLRFAFGEEIRDHQCGLKAFSSEALHRLLPRTEEDSWFWDTEIVVLASTTGIPVAEIPVSWIERKTSRTRIKRLISDLFLHGTGLMRLKSRIRDGKASPSAGTPTFPSLPALPAPRLAGRRAADYTRR